jgi:hypothetical protein
MPVGHKQLPPSDSRGTSPNRMESLLWQEIFKLQGQVLSLKKALADIPDRVDRTVSLMRDSGDGRGLDTRGQTLVSAAIRVSTRELEETWED